MIQDRNESRYRSAVCSPAMSLTLAHARRVQSTVRTGEVCELWIDIERTRDLHLALWCRDIDWEWWAKTRALAAKEDAHNAFLVAVGSAGVLA